MSGVQPMILRSMIPSELGLVCFFAPLRIQPAVAPRTSLIQSDLTYSRSPSKDVRVIVRPSDEHSHWLIVANTLAKSEMSPVFLIDMGIECSEPSIIWPSQLHEAVFVAGSMGIITKIKVTHGILESMMSLASGPNEIGFAIAKMASIIYHGWPEVDLCLRPHNSGPHDPEAAKAQIMADLIHIAPLITGCFAPSAGRAADLVSQTICRTSFASLKLRDISLEDMIAEDHRILKIYLALRRVLLDPRTPVWPFYLLEDVFSVAVQEIVRYSPDLFHLRSRHHYGFPLPIPESALSADQNILVPENIFELAPTIMGSIYPLTDQKITFEQKLAIRNHGLASLNQSPIGDRFDLDVSDPLILGGNQDLTKLAGYIKAMSFKYDWGFTPAPQVIQLILQHSSGNLPADIILSINQ
jgi:hypothetical protein